MWKPSDDLNQQMSAERNVRSLSDEPENLQDYLARHGEPRTGTPEHLRQSNADGIYRKSLIQTWEKVETEKAKRRKLRLAAEAKIARQQEVIEREERRKRERETERIRRDAERAVREEARKLEQQAEAEKRDPTPLFEPSEPPIQITRDVRSRHIFMPGASGNGKSSTMLPIILGDINEQHAVAVLDPKGDLIRRLCVLLPPSRLKDCIYLDVDHPVPLDILAKSGNPEYLIKDIKNFITKGSESLAQAGPRISKLIYCLLQLQHSSFLDMEHFFTRPKRQQAILKSLRKL